MAAEEFGQRMHHDMRAMLERPDQIGRGHGVVDNQGNARLVGDGRNGRDIDDDTAGIGDGFDEDRLGLGRYGLFEGGEII